MNQETYTVSRQIDGFFKEVKNYVTTSPSIEGPWSTPVFINASGFDPSMFHENANGWAYTGAVAGITAVDTFNKDTSALFTEFYQIEGEEKL